MEVEGSASDVLDGQDMQWQHILAVLITRSTAKWGMSIYMVDPEYKKSSGAILVFHSFSIV